MKKTYIQPSLEEIKIATPALLAGSETQPLNSGNPSEWGSSGGRYADEEEEEEW